MSTTSLQRQQFTGCETTSPRSYVGEIKENLRNGYGVYTYSNSFFRYEGEWRAGIKHGFGKLKMRDGSYYEGEIFNGEMSGIGSRYWSSNKNFYEGEFVKGELNGRGVMKFGNGDVYEGAWSDNFMEGEGLYTSTCGSIYTGGFHRHKKHGEGTITSGDEIYKGGWINNMKHGSGFYKCQDGSTYEGQWKADLRHGEGTIQHSSGISYSGLWTNNRPLLECCKMGFENEDNVVLLEQNDVVFSLNVNCLTDDGEITTESGRLLKISAGIRYQEKPATALPYRTTTEENNEVTEERRTTPFGFDVEPYPLCFKVEETNDLSIPTPSPSPSLAKYQNEGPGNDSKTPTIDVTSDGVTSPKEEDIPVETDVSIPPQRTENGRTSFINLTLPATPQARQDNSAMASLSPDSGPETRRRGRRLSDFSTTKLGDFKTNRMKPDLEKVSEDGREGSGGSTRRRRTRPSKQEERMEEVYHESYCRPGDYVIIVDDVTENPFLSVSLDPIFLHVVVQPVIRKVRSKADKK